MPTGLLPKSDHTSVDQPSNSPYRGFTPMIKKNKFVLPIALLTVLSVAAISTSRAALVTFGSAQQITGDSNVSTALPVLVGAFNVGDFGVPGTTVNGVTFQPFAVNSSGGPVTSASVGNFTLSTGIFFASDNTFYGSTLPPFSALSANYQTLLKSATTTFDSPFALTISSLTPNQMYSFQAFVNFSGPPATGPGSDPTDTLHGIDTGIASAANFVILSDNVSGIEGGLGQYVIGTFLADSSTQVINFNTAFGALGVPTGVAQVNAFQLRTVPEPSTVLFGLALGGVCFGRRRRAFQTAKP